MGEWITSKVARLPHLPGQGGARMICGARVQFRKNFVLSLLVPILIVAWVIVPMNAEARILQRLDIAADGTVYQYLCSDGEPGGTVTDRMTNVSMAIALSPASASSSPTQTQGDP